MNAAKFTLTSTILAAALGLGLSLWATPAQSHACKHHDPLDPLDEHCNRGDEQLDGTGFAVILDRLEAGVLTTGAGGECIGTTDRLAKEGLGVQMFFAGSCFVTMTVNFPGGQSTLDLYPFALEVKIKRSGLTEIRLYFTSSVFDGICNPCQADTIWVTDSLMASFDDDPKVASEFVLSPFQPPHGTLIKIHRPDRGAETTNEVSIGRFCYAPAIEEAEFLCGV